MNVFLTGQPEAGNHVLWEIPKILGEGINSWDEEISRKPDAWFLNRGLFFVESHLEHGIEVEERLRHLGFKMILIIRDLRDRVASAYRSVATKQHPKNLFDISKFENLTQEQFINWLILENKVHSHKHFESCYLPWMNVDFCCTVRFEALIGSEGGGDAQLQRKEFKRICEFIGVQQDDRFYIENAPRLYNPKADTFVPGGKIGVWKEYFSQKNIETFERVAGESNKKLGYEK